MRGAIQGNGFTWRFITTMVHVCVAAMVFFSVAAPPASGLNASLMPIGIVYGDCVTSGTPYLTNLSATLTANRGMTFTFSIAGGTNGVPYNVYTTTNPGQSLRQGGWKWLGLGYTCNTYSITNQSTTSAFYIMGPPPYTTVVAWGGDVDVPTGLSNVVAVAGGLDFSMALKSDGTVTAWGTSAHGETNIPSGLNSVIAIAANAYHGLALKSDGTVAVWGAWDYGGGSYPAATVPTNLMNVVAVAAGLDHDLALLGDGTVVSWGYTNEIYDTVPANLPGATAIAAGWDHNVVLLTNGTVSAWGINGASLDWDLTEVPADLTKGTGTVSAISVWALHALALRGDGTVEAWGYSPFGETNVPAGLSNVVAIAAGESGSLALQSGGNVVAWGELPDGPAFVPQGLDNVIGIAAGGGPCLAIRSALLPPVIVEEPEPVNVVELAGGTVTFTAKGEGIGVNYQWQLNGTNITGATNDALTVTNVQATNTGIYKVVAGNGAGASITSSNATLTLLSPPQLVSASPPVPSTNWITTNIILSVVATGADTNQYPLYYQWAMNGTNLPGATSPSLGTENSLYFLKPPDTDGDYSVTVSNADGATNIGPWRIRLLLPGMVAEWGNDGDEPLATPPMVLTNSIGLAAGKDHAMAITDAGAVVAWGEGDEGFTTPPINFTNATAVAAGDLHSLVLTSGGAVVGWGDDTYGQVDVSGLSNIVAIAADGSQSMALSSNGRVTTLGDTFGTVPANLTNATAISAGGTFCLALRGDSTVAAWGENNAGQTNVPTGLTNVVAIAAGGRHGLALKRDGTVTAWGDNSFGQTDVPAGLSNVMAIAAGANHSVALKNDGTILVWGDNTSGQTNVPAGLGGATVKSIAAGGDFTLAAVFSPTVEYPVNVANDLLLIYNTNSAGSFNVLSYYLANRPMVANANVLGIGCTTNETTYPADFTNQIATPILAWSAANPTKHPRYLLMFNDIPTRVNDMVNSDPTDYSSSIHPNVPYQITAMLAGIPPFVDYINMGDTNDCIGYINKLIRFSSIYSPGQLIISASAGGYGNTNYCVDNATSVFTFDSYILEGVTNAIVESETAPFSLTYAGIAGPIITNVANVAAYAGWGVHNGMWRSDYAVNGQLIFTGNSGWYLIDTIESFNGDRFYRGTGYFTDWFASTAFGGTNYSNTPVGAAYLNTDEPGGAGIALSDYSLWAAGKPFGICAGITLGTRQLSVGDPFVKK